VKPKTIHSATKTQANARTARWPWLWLGFWLQLLLLIISRLFHLAPIPATQHAVPTRKPLRVFAYWKLCFSLPRHFGRAIAQILMQPNVVIKKRELVHGLFKLGFAADFNLSNRAFEGAEKSFNAAIGPRAMRCVFLAKPVTNSC